MSTRPMVSYDDITLPYDQPEERDKPSSSSHAAQPPPAKKRKKNNQKAKSRLNDSNRNIPRNKAKDSRSGEYEYEAEMEVAEEEYEEVEESRELTHQEIWDDSALVDAWEAAMEEYKAYHGSEKDWKKEPVKKSPLWYNIPLDPSKMTTNAPSSLNSTHTDNDAEPDSKPLDFDTFVPTYDPSLDPSSSRAGASASATIANGSNTHHIPDTPAGGIVSQDEAFQRALSAMYWGGYWTAMYHCQRQLSHSQNPSTAEAALDGGDNNVEGEEAPSDGGEIEIEVDDDEGLISTQR